MQGMATRPSHLGFNGLSKTRNKKARWGGGYFFPRPFPPLFSERKNLKIWLPWKKKPYEIFSLSE